MNNIIVNNQSIENVRVYQLKPDQLLAAKEAAKKDGLDNVFFEVGGDTFVASGAGVDPLLRGIKKGDPISFQLKQGKITHLNNEMNSVGELTAKNSALGAFFGGSSGLLATTTVGLAAFFPIALIAGATGGKVNLIPQYHPDMIIRNLVVGTAGLAAVGMLAGYGTGVYQAYNFKPNFDAMKPFSR